MPLRSKHLQPTGNLGDFLHPLQRCTYMKPVINNIWLKSKHNLSKSQNVHMPIEKGGERECRKIIEKKKKLLNFITNQQKSFLTSTGFIPTSIMTAPCFIQLPLTIFGCPTAEIMISACLVISSGFLVLEWTILTVASSLYKHIETRNKI